MRFTPTKYNIKTLQMDEQVQDTRLNMQPIVHLIWSCLSLESDSSLLPDVALILWPGPDDSLILIYIQCVDMSAKHVIPECQTSIGSNRLTGGDNLSILVSSTWCLNVHVVTWSEKKNS